MRKFLSSIFSFETIQFIGRPPTGFGGTVVIVLLLLVSAESASRLALEEVGHRWEYWDKLAAVKFEDYRSKASSTDRPDVVIIGIQQAHETLIHNRWQAIIMRGWIFTIWLGPQIFH